MHRTKFWMLCASAVVCAAFLTLSQPTDAGPLDRHARLAGALTAIR